MSDRKAKLLIIFSAIFLVLVGIILYFLFDTQGYSKNKSGGYIKYKVEDYVETNLISYNNYNDFYSNIDVTKIKLKNLDGELIKKFNDSQEEIISYIDAYYKNININDGYRPSSWVISDYKTSINGAVLSLFYELNFNLDRNYFNEYEKNYIITLNIDLGTNRLLTNDDLLSKYNYTKEYIAEKLFNDDVLINDGEIVIDKNTNISLTKNDIMRKKEVYVNTIVNNFDNIIKLYIEDDSLVLVYDKRDLRELFFDNIFDMDIKTRYLK